MEYPVFCGGEETGRVRVEEERGRICAEMTCKGDGRGLYRGFLVGRTGEIPLSVLEPKGEELRLRRTFSREELCRVGQLCRGEMRLCYVFALPSSWEKADPEQFFQRSPGFAGALRTAEDPLCREERGVRLLALPFDCRRPFPLPALFCFARLSSIGDRQYAIFAFDREERPIMMGNMG